MKISPLRKAWKFHLIELVKKSALNNVENISLIEKMGCKYKAVYKVLRFLQKNKVACNQQMFSLLVEEKNSAHLLYKTLRAYNDLAYNDLLDETNNLSSDIIMRLFDNIKYADNMYKALPLYIDDYYFYTGGYFIENLNNKWSVVIENISSAEWMAEVMTHFQPWLRNSSNIKLLASYSDLKLSNNEIKSILKKLPKSGGEDSIFMNPSNLYMHIANVICQLPMLMLAIPCKGVIICIGIIRLALTLALIYPLGLTTAFIEGKFAPCLDEYNEYLISIITLHFMYSTSEYIDETILDWSTRLFQPFKSAKFIATRKNGHFSQNEFDLLINNLKILKEKQVNGPAYLNRDGLFASRIDEKNEIENEEEYICNPMGPITNNFH